MKLSAPPPPPPEPNEPEQPGPDQSAGAGTPAAPDQPATPEAPKTAAWPGWFAGADLFLAALVVLLAFLVASFVARNSDVWLHLAAGQRLLDGTYSPGSDPFSYSAADRTWVNHSWLYDAASYLVYRSNPGALVVLKALFAAAAFSLVIGIRRPGFALWPWAAVSLVAVVAAAPYLQLRPSVGSLFLLAVTLFLLFRVPHEAGSWRFPIAFGVVCWTWANVDEWFFLGPLAILLVLLGELVQGKKSDAEGEGEPLGSPPGVPALARALGIGVLACMLNPHHVGVWQLPFELVGAAGVSADLRFKQILVGPLSSFYTGNAGLGYNHNGLAYAALFVGAGAALGLAAGRVRVSHVALWVGFAALSLGTVYAIPFAALVAVPLIAGQLNSLSARVKLGTWGEPKTRFLLLGSGGGRSVVLLAAVAACVLAWPGWVHPPSNNPAFARRVDWGVEADPAMKPAAEQLQKWRESGRLPADARGVTASVEFANHCAFFAPAEKVYANGRFNHHRPEWPDYLTVRTGLQLIALDEPPDPRALPEVLRKHGAEYVAIHAGPGDTPNMRLLAQVAAANQFADAAHWSPWYLDGRTTVSGWRADRGSGKPTFDALRVDPVLLAFGPGAEQVQPAVLQPIRSRGGWEEEFVRSPKVTPPGADEALAWRVYKEIGQQLQFGVDVAVILADRCAGGVGLLYRPVARLRADEGRRAAPILSLRAARRAIAADPENPDAYFALYRALEDPDLPLSESERAVGQVAALRQCLERMPRPEDFRPGVYSASPTEVAFTLAQKYLGRRNELRGFPVGVPVTGHGFDMLHAAGATTIAVVEAGRPGRRPALMNVPPQYRVPGGPYLFAQDLARDALKKAEEYARVELSQAGERAEPFVKAMLGELKMVETEVGNAFNAYETRRGPQAKLPEQIRAALQQNLPGEALRLLTAKDVDPSRDFGQEALPLLFVRVALELATGRLEDASADLDSLANDPAVKNLNDPGMRGVLRGLLYQRAALAGDYAEAGRVLEELEGGAVRIDQLQPVREAFDPKLYVAAGDGLRNWELASPFAAALAPSALDFVVRLGTPEAALVGYGRGPGYGTLRNQLSQVRAGRSDFFMRRGLLSLFEGGKEGIAAARERFKEAVQPAVPAWGLPEYQNPTAKLYADLIEDAAKRAGGK